jgi:hypothetical protein
MPLTNRITREKLKELYWGKKLSSPKIAKLYHCAPGSIRDLLRKYKIRMRTKSESRRLLFNIKLTKKKLKELYLKKKMSSVEIAKKFKCSPSFTRNKLREYKIPIRPLKEALSLSNKARHPRHNFSGDLEEKAYLIGLRLGDLYVYPENESHSTIYLQTNSTKLEMIKLLVKVFQPYGHIWQGEPDKIGAVCFRCYLNKTFSFLLEKKDEVESWILENQKYFAAFLAGYTDAEGTFCLCDGKGVFSIRSQDKGILHQLRVKLIELGILLRPPQIVRRKGTKDIRGTVSNKDIWAIFIYRKDSLLKLIELLSPYLKHTIKQRQMKIVKNNVLERNRKYNNRQDRRFYKLYLKEGIKI